MKRIFLAVFFALILSTQTSFANQDIEIQDFEIQDLDIQDLEMQDLDLYEAQSRRWRIGMSDFADTWRNGTWELRIGYYGHVEITRYSDYHYRGDSDRPFRLRRSRRGAKLSGRYTLDGKDGRFTGTMTLSFCNRRNLDRLCGFYIPDNLGRRFNFRTFWRH